VSECVEDGAAYLREHAQKSSGAGAASLHAAALDDGARQKTRPDIAILLERFGAGGVERVACLLANGLARHGMRVEFIVLADAGPVRDILDPAIQVTILGKTRSGPRGLRLLRAIPAIARYLGRRRPHIFLSPGNHTHVAAAAAHRLTGTPDIALVAKVTNPLLKAHHPRWRRALTRAFYRRAFARASMILVLSRKGVQRMGAIDPALVARTRFVHNPYVTAAMAPAPAIASPSGPPVILAAGRLSTQKNHAMLLQAAAAIADRPWRIRFAGTGPLEADLRAQAAALGLAERVSFAGFVRDMAPEYRQAAVLALPSLWEDLPATMIEALACGCPVVATACSEAMVSFLEETGATPPVQTGDVAGFARLLAATLDRRPAPIEPALIAPYGVGAAVEHHLATLQPLLAQARESRPAFPGDLRRAA
jgi:glycosyltransferase involved in cell wall biosynthesis